MKSYFFKFSTIYSLQAMSPPSLRNRQLLIKTLYKPWCLQLTAQGIIDCVLQHCLTGMIWEKKWFHSDSAQTETIFCLLIFNQQAKMSALCALFVLFAVYNNHFSIINIIISICYVHEFWESISLYHNTHDHIYYHWCVHHHCLCIV